MLAVLALDEIGDRRAIEPLITALKDPDEGVRRNAILVLMKIKDPRAVEPLIIILNTDSRKQRMWEQPAIAGLAAMALGEIRDQRAVAPLMATLMDPDYCLSRAAARALKLFNDPKIDPVIALYEERTKNIIYFDGY